MIINNFSKLSKDQEYSKTLQILDAGLESALPQKHLEKIVDKKLIKLGSKKFNLKNYESIYLVAFGKAADSMAKAVIRKLKIKKGIVVIPQETKQIITNKKIKVFKSGHPLPNQISVRAAKSIKKFLEQRKKDELVIFLVSGGSSSLLTWPDGISLTDKVQVTKKLLNSGATIQEINCVRKHLSKIKGGRLVEGISCDAVSLIMSDVLGDDLSSIASGITYFDNTKFVQALKIIKKYNLQNKIPKSVLRQLKLGQRGKINETPKKSKIPHHIVLTNRHCLEAMQKKSKQLGISSKIIIISGDVSKASTKLVSLIPKKKNSCLIFGGETTVKVTGKGKGGRNQELVLRILEKLQKTKKTVIISSVGTDGIDGNTKSAGVITKNFLVKENELKEHLKNNDSNSFFKKYGGLINTGYTHTNLMDIGLILN
jgi:hydroxypyruvate reductase